MMQLKAYVVWVGKKTANSISLMMEPVIVSSKQIESLKEFQASITFFTFMLRCRHKTISDIQMSIMKESQFVFLTLNH